MSDMFNFPTHQEMKEIRAELRKNGEAARLLADQGDNPKAGHVYTVSKSFDTGDGSWTDCFWEVLTINGPKAYVRIHQSHGEPICRFWSIDDRAWYIADDAWAMRSV